MVKINKQANRKIEEIDKNNFYVVLDFDKTLSTKNSATTFALFGKSGFYGDEYNVKRSKNYDYYRPLELNPNIPSDEKFALMKKWQEASYQLMLEYKVRESNIKKIITTTNLLELREGAVSFINLLNSNDIPIIINSAGCGNFITTILKLNNCNIDNIYIHSNILEFEDDIVIDSIKDIIHSMNKYDIKLPDYYLDKISGKRFAVVIGDQLSDLNMANNLEKEEVLTFGFLESNIDEVQDLFNEEFDVILENSESFDSIGKILKLKK